MHELAVTENLLAIALRHAQAAGATEVTHLHLVVGQLSSIVDDSVQFYWRIIAKGSIAENALLTFQRIPATFYCATCKADFHLDEQSGFVCPHCDSLDVHVVGGDEFRLESIEVL